MIHHRFPCLRVGQGFLLCTSATSLASFSSSLGQGLSVGERERRKLREGESAWETERDNTLESLQWVHEDVPYRLLPCQGSPCLWTVVPMRPGEDPSVKTFV